MLLFCGIPTEPPLALAISAAERAGVSFAVFNQRQSPAADIALDLDSGVRRGLLAGPEKVWALEEFQGVYNRLIDASELPECRTRNGIPTDPVTVEKVTFLHELLHEWLDLSECRVVNRPRDMGSNASKPYQAQLIRRAGLLVPPTLVTNDPAEVYAFAREHGRIVFKSISSIRSIVTEWSPRLSRDLPKIRHLPVQFQALITGADVRVHIVGETFFATRIESAATDYRYASRENLGVEMRAIDLPPAVADACLSLSKFLRLPFCGIDLKQTPRGEFYCFEVNPSPAYSYYQEQSGQPIAEALVRYLVGTSSS